MKRKLVVGAAVAALLLVSAPAAFAQEAKPTCGAALQAVASFDQADLTAKTQNRDAARKAADAEIAKRDGARAEVARLIKARDDARAEVTRLIGVRDDARRQLAERHPAAEEARLKKVADDADAAIPAQEEKAKLADGRIPVHQGIAKAADAEVTKQQEAADIAGKRVDALQADLAKLEKTRDEVCAPIPGQDGQDGVPGTNPDSTDVPDPSGAPDPSATPETPTSANLIDCVDVSDEEAQRILDADASDPNNLDSDNDNVACEEGDDDTSDTSVFPSAAPETGGI